MGFSEIVRRRPAVSLRRPLFGGQELAEKGEGGGARRRGTARRLEAPDGGGALRRRVFSRRIFAQVSQAPQQQVDSAKVAFSHPLFHFYHSLSVIHHRQLSFGYV